MTNANNLLIFLLTLCIGLAPLQALNAGNPDHMQAMSAGCVDCDMDGTTDMDLCDGAQCTMSTENCATNNVTSISQRVSLSSKVPLYLNVCFFSVTSQYRSRLDFSIYRPPIS